MTQTEALRLALEALEMFCEHGAILRPIEIRNAIKAALEANDKPYALEASMFSNDRVKVDPVTGNVSIGTPQQEANDEPVAWKLGSSGIGGTGVIVQPQRTWVGLTDEHKEGLIYMTDPNPEPHHLRELIDVVEYELRSKNNA